MTSLLRGLSAQAQLQGRCEERASAREEQRLALSAPLPLFFSVLCLLLGARIGGEVSDQCAYSHMHSRASSLSEDSA